MEAETYLYKGSWREAVLSTEEALPAAWKAGEWDVVLWSSAWAATAYLKLGQPADARRLLDKALNEVPARGQRAWPMAVAQIALAQVSGLDDGVDDARVALAIDDGEEALVLAGLARHLAQLGALQRQAAV